MKFPETFTLWFLWCEVILITHEERLRKEYIGRVERAIDYIYAHYGEDLTLDTLADVAAFSRFHFHRVFSGIAGETVSDFLKRVRLQHAASRLAENPSGYQPDDRMCYEVYLAEPENHPEGKFIIEICEPVRPL